MIFVALGTYSSGSTWVFNVLRQIVSTYSYNSASVFCNTGEDLLKHLSNVEGDIVVKSHAPDLGMIKLLELCGAKIIVTTRDPRDSFVSMQERFSTETRQLISQMSYSFGSIANAVEKLNHMRLNYEDGFTNNPDTIKEIAKYIDINIEEKKSLHIFEINKMDAVKSKIKTFADNGHKSDWADPETHWHPNHVGDGAIGKWEGKIPLVLAQALYDAFGSFLSSEHKIDKIIYWRPDLYFFCDERNNTLYQELIFESQDKSQAWGPYLCLPAGRWRFEFMLETVKINDSVEVQVDIVVIGSNSKVVGLHRAALPQCDKRDLTIEFDHNNHLEPIEARVTSFAAAGTGRLLFSGVKITRVGDARPTRSSAVPISPYIEVEVKSSPGRATDAENLAPG